MDIDGKGMTIIGSVPFHVWVFSDASAPTEANWTNTNTNSTLEEDIVIVCIYSGNLNISLDYDFMMHNNFMKNVKNARQSLDL
mgnify:CR=1 FL=1